MHSPEIPTAFIEAMRETPESDSLQQRVIDRTSRQLDVYLHNPFREIRPNDTEILRVRTIMEDQTIKFIELAQDGHNLLLDNIKVDPGSDKVLAVLEAVRRSEKIFELMPDLKDFCSLDEKHLLNPPHGPLEFKDRLDELWGEIAMMIQGQTLPNTNIRDHEELFRTVAFFRAGSFFKPVV